jgi:NADP-dependent 3-hydroxy acid dehydrogenase YdfG
MVATTSNWRAGVAEDATSVAGKAIIVTGGTTGIGRAIARLLAVKGAKVFTFGRKQEDLNEALEEIQQLGTRAHGTIADQSRREDIERIFREAEERIGGCDILINNAAVSDAGALAEAEFDKIAYTVNANLVGYLACTHEALVRMKKSGGGHIVNVGSMSADLREEEGEVYVATKAAIQAFTESLRKSANKENIRVTLIEPGAVATPLQEKSQAEERMRIAAEKMLTPDDIARCVLFALTQPNRVDIVTMQVRPLKQII